MGEQERFELDMQMIKLRDKKQKRRVWTMRLLTLLAASLLCFFVFGISVVQGDSMRPVYRDGDLVFFIRIPDSPDYGDVVIIEDPEGKEVIKRIAGLAGDTITVYDNGRFVRNQTAVQEQDIIYSTTSGGSWQRLTVPKDSYFYLGDNRPVSKDSRQDGCAGKERIKGKVLATFRR